MNIRLIKDSIIQKVSALLLLLALSVVLLIVFGLGSKSLPLFKIKASGIF